MGLFSGLVSSIAGPAIGGLLGLAGQSSANKANAQLASEANATSIDLANTAHQREVKDLMAAGLNPMLSYHTSGSATPQMHVAKMENTADSASRSASSASTIGVNSMQNQLIRSQIDTQATQADLNSATAAKVRAETLNTPLQGHNIAAQTDHIIEQINALGFTNALTNTQRQLVDAEIRNAFEENRRIRADTGNKIADKALKEADTALRNQEIDFNILDTPRRTADSVMHSSAFGKEMLPYINSAKGVDLLTIPKAEIFKAYRSRK
jgi:hypothetical protein